jgi:hypothetical protein
MLEGDYSPSDSGDEEPSAAPHVDLDKAVEAINEKLGAHYSGKYRLSRFIKYNGERYTPQTSQKDQLQTRSDNKKFDRSKGNCKQFCQAVFNFPTSINPRASYHGRGGKRVNKHLLSLFAITTGNFNFPGKDKGACFLRFHRQGAARLILPREQLKPHIEELKKAHDGKSFCLEHEDKEGFSKSIDFIAGLVKDTVDYMEAVEIKLKTKRTPAKTVGVRVLAAAPLKREVVDRYWGLEANVVVCRWRWI